ncbi:helix-turn-helix domain-containing protein [Mucilaginibacter jinjuensis]|uniref:AraC family transcriptional regulator n=1 Tax=Mucilaginibacter jinjuensis TaxID=1176721 RepID=A0ABY7TE44_9SPHI|nr:AraC family transcriptional regulator [Mucilaginibacter jinjuensis]WCT14320.1 AraC family transcriptional regulator [Mucilaginibacter jinjuensis]
MQKTDLETAAQTKGRIFVSCKREKHYSRELILDQHALVYIIAGTMKIIYSDQVYTFERNSLILIPRNQLGRLIKLPAESEPFRSVSILFPPDVLRSFYQEKPINLAEKKWSGHLQVRQHPLIENFFQSLVPYFDVNDELPDELASLKIRECLTLLDAYDGQTKRVLAVSGEPGKIDLADFMDQHFIFNLSLEKFGYLTGRSLTTFKKDFKQLFQMTPGRWLTAKRLERARYQIAVQHRKPIDVFVEVGFENLSHFSIAFKKQFGYSPAHLPDNLFDR